METRKEKFIKILKRVGMVLSIGFNVVFLIAIIVGFIGSKKQSNKVNVACAESEVVNLEYQNKKFVSYNDESHLITFVANELNNYIWDNLYTYLIEVDNYSYFDNTYFELPFLDDTQLEFDSTDNNMLIYSYVAEEISYHSYDMGVLSDDKTISLFDSTLEESVLFEGNIYWYLSVNVYSDIKQAIELDIQANSVNINDGIFATMTDSIVAFVGSLSSGITAMVGVFYDSVEGNLTAIGLLSVIVVAISLCYFLFRLIIGLIRMRG